MRKADLKHVIVRGHEAGLAAFDQVDSLIEGRSFAGVTHRASSYDHVLSSTDYKFLLQNWWSSVIVLSPLWIEGRKHLDFLVSPFTENNLILSEDLARFIRMLR